MILNPLTLKQKIVARNQPAAPVHDHFVGFHLFCAVASEAGQSSWGLLRSEESEGGFERRGRSLLRGYRGCEDYSRCAAEYAAIVGREQSP